MWIRTVIECFHTNDDSETSTRAPVGPEPQAGIVVDTEVTRGRTCICRTTGTSSTGRSHPRKETSHHGYRDRLGIHRSRHDPRLRDTVSGIDIQMIGWILIFVGAAMLSITFMYTRPRQQRMVSGIVEEDPLYVNRQDDEPVTVRPTPTDSVQAPGNPLPRRDARPRDPG